MPATKTGNKAFDDQALLLETQRQSVAVPGVSQANIMSAEITYFRGMIKNALATGVSPSNFTQALKSLGWQT
jgi:hypothetical protein